MTAPDDSLLVGGVAVYEALRTYGGRLFRAQEHIARLEAGAAWLGAPLPARAPLAAELAAAVAAVPGGEARVLVVLPPSGAVLVRARRLDAARVGRAVRVATLAYEPHPALPGWVKHTGRALGDVVARRAGVDEVLYVGADGTWTETNKGNVLAVRGGVLHTPPLDGRILPGVTRAALVEAARAAGVPIVETPLSAGGWDELYVCSTLKELAPIVAVDGAAAPGAGPVGHTVLAAFRRIVAAATQVV